MHRPLAFSCILATFASAAFAVPAAAQRADSLPVGVRVRVHRLHPPPAVVTGVLAGADSAGLTLTAPDGSRPRVVPLAEVRRIEQFAGRRSSSAAFWRGAGRGALVGVGLSAVLVTAAVISERRDPCWDCFINAPVAAAVVSVPLTAVTTLVGGAIGVQHRDRWAPLARP